MAAGDCQGTNVRGEPCESPFVADGSDWCSRHDPARADYWRAMSKKGGQNRRRTRKTCSLDGCSKRLPKDRSKWCSDEHSQLGRQRAKTEAKLVQSGVVPVAAQMRRPPQLFYDEGWHLKSDNPDFDACAARFNVDRTTAVRWYAYVRQQAAFEAGKADWSPPARDFPERWRDLDESHIPALIADFLWFRATFIETEDEEPYLVAPFHESWIEALIQCFVTRGRLMILSPPRHGKTELLAHLALWLIARFPNIRIIWVGPSDEIAELVGQEVLDHLELNQALIDAFCGPGGQFKPKGKGRAWVKSEMTVGTRTVFGIKSPTAKFQGRGGTLVSRDADIIIADDIEQDKTVYQPGTREKTRNWASTSLFSRKTKKTAIAFIGSRQHPDDLWQHFLDNDMFTTIVETAHDPNCEIEDDPDLYDSHVDCMLWPELNDYAWLAEMRSINETLGGPDTFEMVYLNRTTSLGMVIFKVEEIIPCRDTSYPATTMPKLASDSSGIRLVAGLDPSGSGYQAAFLWAYQIKPTLHLWMVDIENNLGGGIAAARKTIQGWHEKYAVAHWVVEENLYHGGIIKDEKIVEYRDRHGLVIEGTWTYGDKWDPYLGVSTLRPWFLDQTITLPYADTESKVKSDAYQRQLVNFSNAPRNRNTKGGYKSDLVMASWFPLGVIRRAQQEWIAEMGVDYEPEYADFTGYDFDVPPWETKRIA